MAETPDPKADASSSISDPVPVQPENPKPNSEPSTNSNPNPPTAITPPPFPPSFRPLGPPIMPPQYGSVTVSAPPIRYPPPPHYPYGQVVSNGFMAVPPPGMPHYQGPYPTMVRPGFHHRPLPPMGVIPQIPRPPIPGAPIVPPPSVRPVVPAVAAIEKPQTTVYVGKIASSVENDFMLSLLRICGPVKSWKRAQDPSNGTPKGFGFCEFEAAEGILRALRLLTRLNIDGQELVLNINKTTKEYLDRYVEKKTEREKLKEIENQTLEKENKTESDAEKHESPKATIEEAEKSPDSGGEDHEYKQFGIVSDEDREVDKDFLEKIAGLIKERLKKNPLPPPPPPLPIQNTVTTKSNSERPSKSGDGDSDIGNLKSSEGKNEDEITSGVDPTTAKEKAETNSPNRGSKNDSNRERDREKDRERDRERDSKREKERELERSERERERERVRREKDRESKVREVERLYNNRLKDWEAREREQEHRRLKEKEREKEKLKERRREISKEEDGSDNDEDDTRKRRRRRSTLEEKRRKREREKEEDLIDRIKEEEEIAEAKKRAIEEERRIEEMKLLNTNDINEENGNGPMKVDDHLIAEEEKMDVDFAADGDNGDIINSNETDEEMTDAMKHNNDAPTKKLGFGLVASGKKTTVPSVFHEEDDENIEDKKMRPLVPLDYSTEELQSVQTTPHSSTPPNLLAAAEFAKRISGVSNSKEKKSEVERDRNGRSSERGRHRDRDRDREYNDNKEKGHDRSYDRDREDKPKPENKKLLDAKQLIDMIPKTKQELFSYEINWAVYDKHDLHEKMRPWISKKITEFLGEEEETLVEYIVSSTKDHVQASKMLELLQSILDDEAEMFVLKMWRMLIFEIKRVETGLSVKQKP